MTGLNCISAALLFRSALVLSRLSRPRQFLEFFRCVFKVGIDALWLGIEELAILLILTFGLQAGVIGGNGTRMLQQRATAGFEELIHVAGCSSQAEE